MGKRAFRSNQTRRGKSRRGFGLLLVTILGLALLLGWTGVALAEDTTSSTEVTATQATAAEAPELDYTFTWPTFLLVVVLVVGYYIFIFRMSEKEFKGVIFERFGPKR
ncbi:MAG: hypothetical protein M5U22_00515 [Thermoleophilia bacterium]|nr:hypothetical protein [Thermoleophilia bacterium]